MAAPSAEPCFSLFTWRVAQVGYFNHPYFVLYTICACATLTTCSCIIGPHVWGVLRGPFSHPLVRQPPPRRTICAMICDKRALFRQTTTIDKPLYVREPLHWWGQMTIAFIIALAFAVFTGVLCVMHIRMVCRRVLSIAALPGGSDFVNRDGLCGRACS